MATRLEREGGTANRGHREVKGVDYQDWRPSIQVMVSYWQSGLKSLSRDEYIRISRFLHISRLKRHLHSPSSIADALRVKVITKCRCWGRPRDEKAQNLDRATGYGSTVSFSFTSFSLVPGGPNFVFRCILDLLATLFYMRSHFSSACAGYPLAWFPRLRAAVTSS